MQRVWQWFAIAPCFGITSILVGCMGTVIDAGSSSDAGANSGPTVDAAIAPDGGPTIIATEIQLTPDIMVSDGTSLYWISGVGDGSPVSSMPVNGGAVTVVPGPIGVPSFLVVDDVNVYYLGNGGTFQAPKNGGGMPTPFDDEAGPMQGVTVLGSTLYWTPNPATPAPVVESSPLQGVAEFSPGGGMAVTSTTVFFTVNAVSFPLSTGALDGGMSVPELGGCLLMLSDTNAVYCETSDSILAVASDGTVTSLGPALPATMGEGGNVAFDDTYVYWVDEVMVGTIMRAPKTGGAAASIIARDTLPVAIAVDGNAVYWSDEGGNIWRLAK